MKNIRERKLIVIIILVLAVTGLSIGLATFSNVLTISSSATVKPNHEEYNMKIYGFSYLPSDLSGFKFVDYFEYLDDNIGIAFNLGDTISSIAHIDNVNFTISNINVEFNSNSWAVSYPFMMKNEGAYDIYIDLAQFEKYKSGMTSKVCTAEDSSNQSLVDEYCNEVISNVGLSTSGEDNILEDVDYASSYKIAPNDYVFIAIGIGVNFGTIENMEENFDVAFENVSIEFSATDKYAQ